MKYFFLFSLALCLLACETSEPKVSTTLFDVKPTYEPYQKVLNKNSRSTTVFSNYESLYMLNVAGFTPEFYDAFTSALKERLRSTDMLVDIRTNSSFFVSIFSPNEEYNDLSNPKLWEFILTVDGKEYKSKLVKKIKDREAWTSFFTFMNRWSNEFLIVFEIPETDGVPENAKRALSLSTSKVKTQMIW